MTTFGEIGGKDALWWDDVVSEEVNDSGRWVEYVSTVVKHEDKYYEVQWQRGLTEYQENEYPDESEEVTEVFPHSILEISKKTVYTDVEPSQSVALSPDTLESFEALGLGSEANSELETLKALNVSEILETLEALKVLPEDDVFSAYLEATTKFFESFSE